MRFLQVKDVFHRAVTLGIDCLDKEVRAEGVEAGGRALLFQCIVPPPVLPPETREPRERDKQGRARAHSRPSTNLSRRNQQTTPTTINRPSPPCSAAAASSRSCSSRFGPYT